MLPVLRFRARSVETTPDLTQLIREKSAHASGNCVVADLTLGSWTPNSLAVQLLSQITGKEMAVKAEAPTASSSLGESMSAGIDAEGKGNKALLDATGMARQIARALKTNPAGIIILAPCYGVSWRTEDRLLLEYLRHFYPSFDVTLAMAAKEYSPWPEGWDVEITESSPSSKAEAKRTLASRLPSALAPSVLKSLSEEDREGIIPLPNGWAIVSPESRVPPNDPESRFKQNQIAALNSRALAPFRAYAAYRSESAPAEPWLFCAEAWKHFGSGYRELALFYIALAEAAAKVPAEKTTLTCHKQAMRIAMARYQEAAGESDPEPQVTGQVRGFLLETKGWGLVMSGNGKAALPYLREALTLCKPETIDLAYLFLMNITALAEVRSGNAEKALEMEREIDRLIVLLNVSDARLLFVNSLNLARLYRYAGEIDQCEALYRSAFTTVEGARTETDSINANLCLARVAEGRADDRESFLAWLRASLHWAASDCPESLNWRVQSLVLGKDSLTDVQSITEAFQLVERLADAFLQNLQKRSEKCGFVVQSDSLKQRDCHFRYATMHTRDFTPQRYVGGAGWAVMTGAGPQVKREYGPRYRELNRWLHAWIASSAAQQNETACYWIDGRDGVEMPQSWPEFLASAVDFTIGTLNYEGVSTTLNTSELEALVDSREAKLSSSVAYVDESGTEAVAHFKRYLQPYTLLGQELLVFRTLQFQPNIASAKFLLQEENLSGTTVEKIVARLRKVRILQMSRRVSFTDSAEKRSGPRAWRVGPESGMPSFRSGQSSGSH